MTSLSIGTHAPRFFRWIARQLATKLRSLDTKPQPKQTETKEKEEKESVSSSGDDENNRKPTVRPANSLPLTVSPLRSTSQAKLMKDSKKGKKDDSAGETDEDFHDKFGIDSKEPLFKVHRPLVSFSLTS